jgi:dienelactone hydrolase
LQAVVCLHGDLDTSLPAKPGDIRAALLVLHGSKDPVSPKSQRDSFEAEMDAAGAKWQMLTFGGLVHSFSESEADVSGVAEYDEAAARQSYLLLDQFIQNAFAGHL